MTKKQRRGKGCGARYAAMGPIVLRVVGKPTDVHDIIEAYRPSAWIAHAMNGIVLMALADAQMIEAVRQKFPAVIEKAPLRDAAAASGHLA